MAIVTLIIGESGTGKSTSIRTLDATKTLIINVLDKPLPFKDATKKYIRLTKDIKGNYYSSDNHIKIMKVIEYASNPENGIENVIIDDFQYVMSNEFMRRATERGYDKFTEIGCHAWQVIYACLNARDNMFFFILSHADNEGGKSKCKTIGKMLDEKITIEGMFTTVLHSLISDGKYKFLTHHDGAHLAKSPIGMFEDEFIDNDLCFVKEKITHYYTGDDHAV